MTFIIIEGLDGSGKTTLINNLKKVLTEHNYSSQNYQGLGSSTLGSEIRALFLKSNLIHSNTRFFLSITNMAQIFEELIKPAIKKQEIIILDRWLASTYAYQLFPFQKDVKVLQNIFQEVLINLFYPSDLLVYIDVNPGIGITRKKQQDHHKLDVIEQKPLSYFEKVRDGYFDYLTNYHKGKILVLSGDDSMLTNAYKIYKYLRKEKLL